MFNFVGNMMAQKVHVILFTLALFTIAGCSNNGETITVSSNSIDAEEVLTFAARIHTIVLHVTLINPLFRYLRDKQGH